jgi:ParB family chromosome partitioning protein
MAKNILPPLKPPPPSLFQSTDPDSLKRGNTVYEIPRDKLMSFVGHPFKLYTGEKLDSLVESIRENGIMLPLIVRPKEVAEDKLYEIISGHNRENAAGIAGLISVPCIIKEGLTDEEALMILIVTNLLQRSFEAMSHSERASALSMHHQALKQQGRRTDIIKEVENLLNANDSAENSTSSPVANKLKSLSKVGEEHALSKDTVARYIRVNKLIASLKERLDNDEFGIRPAVAISYLPEETQHHVAASLEHHKLDTKKADSLRLAAQRKPLTAEDVGQIMAGEKKPPRATSFKLKPKFVAKYFHGQTAKQIEDIISTAMDFYLAAKAKEEQND